MLDPYHIKVIPQKYFSRILRPTKWVENALNIWLSKLQQKNEFVEDI